MKGVIVIGADNLTLAALEEIKDELLMIPYPHTDITDTSIGHCESTWNDTTTLTEIIYSLRDDIDEALEEIMQQLELEKLRNRWSKFQQRLRPQMKLNSIQLRGVCYGGRGWGNRNIN